MLRDATDEGHWGHKGVAVHAVLRRLTVGGVAAVALAAAVSAQQGRFRSGVDLVNVGVMVLDKRGNFITDLTARDFEVYEEGERQTVSYFSRGDTAGEAENLRLGLLFDTSGSMHDDIELARTAAIKFLKGLPEAQDITLVDFDTEVRIARYGQQDFPRMIERIRGAKAGRAHGAVRRARRLSGRPDRARWPEGAGHLHRRRRHAQRRDLRRGAQHAEDGRRHGVRGRLSRAPEPARCARSRRCS